MITTSGQKAFFKPSDQFTVDKQLDRFDADVVEKPFFTLLSELSNFIRNYLHLEIPMEMAFLMYQGASKIFLSTLFWNRWMKSVLLCLCIPTAVCSRSTQTSIFVWKASTYCASTGPIFFPWVNTIFCILVQTLRVFSWHVSSSAAWHPELNIVCTFFRFRLSRPQTER